ncbi:hypothetical protein [Bernardetia sp. MNP-M8]|uniref:hypothetical protein n=1 Tax=Bernardetia sp. MNP-M8 TaxID=3127470 RepID=UPI0030D1C682
MNHKKKESWDKIIERNQSDHRINFTVPTLEWLKSKGCDQLFYPHTALEDLVLKENSNFNDFSSVIICFGFSKMISHRLLNLNLKRLETQMKNDNNWTSKVEKELLEQKRKVATNLDTLLITIKTETAHYSHITKINEYDEFELILDKILSNLS